MQPQQSPSHRPSRASSRTAQPTTPPPTFEGSIGANRICLSYSSSPQRLHIKIVNSSKLQMMEMVLTRDLLDAMDSSIMATFDTLHSMYCQLVEILRIHPHHFTIDQPATLRIKITLCLKSATKTRQLVLQTQSRPLKQIQQLSLAHQATSSLVQSLQQENKLLRDTLQLETTTRKNLETQRDLEIQELRAQILEMKLCIRLLMAGAKKIGLEAQIGGKSKGFKLETRQGEQLRLMKVGKEKWAQVVFKTPIQEPLSYFDLEIVRSKTNYICMGICQESCMHEQDSKWSKNSITMFLLDRSIIVEGKQTQNNGYQFNNTINTNNIQWYSSIKTNGSSASGLVTNGNTGNDKNSTRVRVVTNSASKWVEWYINGYLVGKAYFSQTVAELCRNGRMRPIVCCQDEDQFIIR